MESYIFNSKQTINCAIAYTATLIVWPGKISSQASVKTRVKSACLKYAGRI